MIVRVRGSSYLRSANIFSDCQGESPRRKQNSAHFTAAGEEEDEEEEEEEEEYSKQVLRSYHIWRIFQPISPPTDQPIHDMT